MTQNSSRQLPKVATGIAGFDALSRGGLPQGRISLLKGGAGSGKTLFALQCLISAVRLRGERGIFVAFEESTSRLVANSVCFDWGMESLANDEIFFLDSQLSPEVVHAGEFDLSGMLAILGAKKRGDRCALDRVRRHRRTAHPAPEPGIGNARGLPHP